MADRPSRISYWFLVLFHRECISWPKKRNDQESLAKQAQEGRVTSTRGKKNTKRTFGVVTRLPALVVNSCFGNHLDHKDIGRFHHEQFMRSCGAHESPGCCSGYQASSCSGSLNGSSEKSSSSYRPGSPGWCPRPLTGKHWSRSVRNLQLRTFADLINEVSDSARATNCPKLISSIR